MHQAKKHLKAASRSNTPTRSRGGFAFGAVLIYDPRVIKPKVGETVKLGGAVVGRVAQVVAPYVTLEAVA